MGTYLWQNFLIDSKIKDYIAEKIKNTYEKNNYDIIVEIWPWKLAITKRIFQIPKNFFVIEKDTEMQKWLEDLKISNTKDKVFEIIMNDVLDVDLESELKKFGIQPEKTLIIWNLPYYITSPILRKFFGNGEMKFWSWIFMLQDEVWQKIKSDANKKSYLRRLLNYWYSVKYLKSVPAKCFKPAPKVKSCLVNIEMSKRQNVETSKSKIKFDELVQFLDLFAPYSRKTVWKIQKMVEKKWFHYDIPEILMSKRLEELDLFDIEKIVQSKLDK